MSDIRYVSIHSEDGVGAHTSLRYVDTGEELTDVVSIRFDNLQVDGFWGGRLVTRSGRKELVRFVTLEERLRSGTHTTNESSQVHLRLEPRIHFKMPFDKPCPATDLGTTTLCPRCFRERDGALVDCPHCAGV